MLESRFKRKEAGEEHELKLNETDSLLVIKADRDCLLITGEKEEHTPFQKSTQIILETVAYMLTNEDREFYDFIERKYQEICNIMSKEATIH